MGLQPELCFTLSALLKQMDFENALLWLNSTQYFLRLARFISIQSVSITFNGGSLHLFHPVNIDK